MQFIHDDGGRKEAGWKGEAGDCVTRSLAIATGKLYQEVYDALNGLAKTERTGKRKKHRSSARNGVYKACYRRYLESLGWRFVPCMAIGSGCKVHLHDGELPQGRLIVKLSRHLTAVVDGVIHDTHDPQRTILVTENGVQRITHRAVYGYFHRPQLEDSRCCSTG